MVRLSSTSDALWVKGGTDDEVVLNGNWASTGTTGVDFVTYNIYTSGAATLLVQDGVEVSTVTFVSSISLSE